MNQIPRGRAVFFFKSPNKSCLRRSLFNVEEAACMSRIAAEVTNSYSAEWLLLEGTGDGLPFLFFPWRPPAFQPVAWLASRSMSSSSSSLSTAKGSCVQGYEEVHGWNATRQHLGPPSKQLFRPFERKWSWGVLQRSSLCIRSGCGSPKCRVSVSQVPTEPMPTLIKIFEQQRLLLRNPRCLT